MFQVTLVSGDASLITSLRGPLVDAGYEVVALAGSEESEPDPAAAADVLAVDWRGASLRPAPPFVEMRRAWPRALLIAVVTSDQLADLPPNIEDFVLPPLAPEEFVARIRQALWRRRGAGPGDLIVAGDLRLDLTSFQVLVGGQAIALTYMEYQLLRYLMTHAGMVVTRETLLNRVWGYDYYGGMRTVDVHIRRLRAKLGSVAARQIETVRNAGYRFAEVPGP